MEINVGQKGRGYVGGGGNGSSRAARKPGDSPGIEGGVDKIANPVGVIVRQRGLVVQGAMEACQIPTEENKGTCVLVRRIGEGMMPPFVNIPGQWRLGKGSCAPISGAGSAFPQQDSQPGSFAIASLSLGHHRVGGKNIGRVSLV